MSRSRELGAAAGDYEVGFARPPAASRFKPGQSGNPRGRPGGTKSIARLLEEALSARVAVKEQGKTRRLTMREVIIRGIVNDAARREPKAVRLLLTLISQHQDGFEPTPGPEALGPDDQEILRDYLARHGGNGVADGRAAAEGADHDDPSNEAAGH